MRLFLLVGLCLVPFHPSPPPPPPPPPPSLKPDRNAFWRDLFLFQIVRVLVNLADPSTLPPFSLKEHLLLEAAGAGVFLGDIETQELQVSTRLVE